MIVVEKRIDDLIARLEDLFSEGWENIPLTNQEQIDIKEIEELRVSFNLNQNLSVKQLLKLNEISKRNLPSK